MNPLHAFLLYDITDASEDATGVLIGVYPTLDSARDAAGTDPRAIDEWEGDQQVRFWFRDAFDQWVSES